jgi:hypothetical protein
MLGVNDISEQQKWLEPNSNPAEILTFQAEILIFSGGGPKMPGKYTYKKASYIII